MFEANVKIIEELKQFVSLVMNNPELLAKFSISKGAFTRKRKLTFDRIVLLIVKLCKKTLSVELETFFEQLQVVLSCSVSAFTQQRMKLHPKFYQAWNSIMLLSYYYHSSHKIRRWKGYRIIAADGSNISLVDTPALQAYFGGQSNQLCSFVQARTFYQYDVLNALVIRSHIEPYRTGELTMAYKSIDSLENDMLMIYDRNFLNYKMIALHLWKKPEIKFIIRAKESPVVIKSFIASNATSAIVYFHPTKSAIIGLGKSGYKIDKNTPIKVRLVRVELEKSIEVLATNLWQEEYSVSDFKDLYFKRWQIETNIGLQKNILQLESFSGLTVQSVLQDFFATVFITNLHSILIKNAQQTIDNEKTPRKYPLKVNHNKSHGKLRNSLIELFISKHPKAIIKILNEFFKRDPIPIRKGRSFPRVVKNKQAMCKHKTFMNYKPAY